ncbi:MAG: hypothetical protein ACOC1P_06325 [Minisyncoccales bacterium]
MRKLFGVLAATLGIVSYAQAHDLIVIKEGKPFFLSDVKLTEDNKIISEYPILDVRLSDGRVLSSRDYNNKGDFMDSGQKMIPILENFDIDYNGKDLEIHPPPLFRIMCHERSYYACTDSRERADLFKEELENKIIAFNQGIEKVESLYGSLVNKVILIDLGIMNSYTLRSRNDVFVYPDFLKKNSIKNINIAAEHEALHKLVDSERYTQNETIRNIFGRPSCNRDNKIDALHRYWNQKPSELVSLEGKSDFFDNINEGSYIPGADGGASCSNIDEFCTSFLHTFMYQEIFLDKLPEKYVDLYYSISDVFYDNSTQRAKNFFHNTGYKMKDYE